MKRTLWSTMVRFRRPVVIAAQIVAVIFSNWFAFALRFDNQVPLWAAQAFLQMLPWLVVIRALTFIPFRLYEGFWRYTSLWDLRNISIAVLSSTALFYLVTISP